MAFSTDNPVAQDLGYLPFDCDNHYYEALDAFTRHVPKEWHARCVQWAEIDGRKHHVVGGKLAHAVKNPTWNPIAMPGAISDFLRGNPDGTNMMKALREREPLPDYYMDPDARIKKMDEELAELVASPPLQPNFAMAARDVEKPEDCRIRVRGEQMPVAGEALAALLGHDLDVHAASETVENFVERALVGEQRSLLRACRDLGES